jgi:hypothetical protein
MSSGLCMVLVLPSMFGLTLVAEGVWKVLHQKFAGFLSIIFGFIFVSAVFLGWLIFSGKL